MSIITNLQAVQYSLDNPGCVLKLERNTITLIDKTDVDTSNVVFAAAWFSPTTTEGQAPLDANKEPIRLPLLLHVKGSTKDADKVGKIVTDLLAINHELSHEPKGEYEAYNNLRNRREMKQSFPWDSKDESSKPTDAISTVKANSDNQVVSKKPSSDKPYAIGSSRLESRTNPIIPSFTIPATLANACDAEAEADADADADEWFIPSEQDLPTNNSAQDIFQLPVFDPELNAHVINYSTDPLLTTPYDSTTMPLMVSWDTEKNLLHFKPIQQFANSQYKKDNLIFYKIKCGLFSNKGFYIQEDQKDIIKEKMKIYTSKPDGLFRLQPFFTKNNLHIKSWK